LSGLRGFGALSHSLDPLRPTVIATHSLQSNRSSVRRGEAQGTGRHLLSMSLI